MGGVGRLALGGERVLNIGEPKVRGGGLLRVEPQFTPVTGPEVKLARAQVDISDLGGGAVS
jgi:hypothetical protein